MLKVRPSALGVKLLYLMKSSTEIWYEHMEMLLALAGLYNSLPTDVSLVAVPLLVVSLVLEGTVELGYVTFEVSFWTLLVFPVVF
jgi:hypothetical protein